jgi:hypothetical protein
MSTTWFVWNPNDILFFAMLSLAVFAILKYTKDPSFERIQKAGGAAWFGSGVSFLGFFFVGLYCLISLALYLGAVYALEHFVNKYKKQEAVKVEEKTKED